MGTWKEKSMETFNERKLIASNTESEHELQLWSHTIDGKKEYELVINGVFIMATYNSLSSELLVKNTIKDMDRIGKKLLIGGLGFAYSVKEACNYINELSGIYVVEQSRTVIEWDHTLLQDLNGRYLRDRKVHVIQDDFIAYVMDTKEKFDAICMDIDNGPMLLIHESNGRAYTEDFYGRIKEILNTGGLFSIWSGNKDRQLYDGMLKVFENCRMDEVTEDHFGKAASYYIYTGCKQF